MVHLDDSDMRAIAELDIGFRVVDCRNFWRLPLFG
jgi:hypothetical protein